MIIKGNLYLGDSSIESLGYLKEVRGVLFIGNCLFLRSLGDLQIVWGNLIIPNSLENIGNLKEIKHSDLDIHSNNIKSLGDLEYVDGAIRLQDSENLKDLGKLKYSKASINLENCKSLKTLGDLQYIEGGYKSSIYLRGSGITYEYVKKEKPLLLSKCRFL